MGNDNFIFKPPEYIDYMMYQFETYNEIQTVDTRREILADKLHHNINITIGERSTSRIICFMQIGSELKIRGGEQHAQINKCVPSNTTLVAPQHAKFELKVVAQYGGILHCAHFADKTYREYRHKGNHNI